MPDADDNADNLKISEEKLISSDRPEPNARLQLWLSFAKFVLGTVIVGIVTTILNHQIQKRELEMKGQEAEKEYVRHFLGEAMEENLERRMRFAHYFASLLQGKWTVYYQELRSEFDKGQIQLAKAQEETTKLARERAEAEARIEAAKVAIAAARAEQAKLEATAQLEKANAALAVTNSSLEQLEQRAEQLKTELNPAPRPVTSGEWQVIIGDYATQEEAGRKKEAAIKAGYTNGEVFGHEPHLHLRFTFGSREAANNAAIIFKQQKISHEPDVLRFRPPTP